MSPDFTDNMSKFLNAYITCALWSSTDDSDDALDSNFCKEDIDADSIMLMTVDCYNFYHKNLDIILELPESYSYAQVGHDFWLTRNGHGVGFWDRGLGRLGSILSRRARAEGEVYLFVENNKVHYS